MRTQWEGTSYEPGRGLSLECDHANTSVLNFPTSRTVRIRNLLLINHPVCGILYSSLNGLRHQPSPKPKLMDKHFSPQKTEQSIFSDRSACGKKINIYILFPEPQACLRSLLTQYKGNHLSPILATRLAGVLTYFIVGGKR